MLPVRFKMIESQQIKKIIKNALHEDMPSGDITSESVVPKDSVSTAILIAKEKGILAGIEIAESVFKFINAHIRFSKFFKDGDAFKKGDTLAEVYGNSISLLKGERTALNFLQRLSGIATLTNRYVQALRGKQVKLLDTRKTTPGLRILEKYAVKMGGGWNHRLNLSEMVLLKDNHIKLIGSIAEAVSRARSKVNPEVRIEVETCDLKQVQEAFHSRADIIMLDNMPLDMITKAVEWIRGRVPLEVSGKVNLRRLEEIAATGVDYISVGCLTHSFKSLDISMDFLS